MDLQQVNILLKRVAKNDKRAFDDLFDYYYPRLLKFSRNFVKSYEDAEEVVMDVFVNLLNKRNGLSLIENFNSYIYLAVKNRSLSFLNKSKPELINNDDEEDYFMVEYANPESKLIDQELFRILKETIDNLPVKRRTVYKLIKEDGLQYQEVAKLMNISKKTVEVHMGLAVHSIRASISSYLADKKINIPVRKIVP